MIPIAPPAEWFDQPEPDHPEPLTIEPDGRVHGHLAPWDGCHAGLVNGTARSCISPPKSVTDYRMFHLGQLETAEGDMVPVGKIVVGGSHASTDHGVTLQAATTHYDKTGSVAAFVRARNGRHGIFLSGAVKSDIRPEQLRDLRANLPSGDWRNLNHNLELIGALAVPVPGYGIPAVVASVGGEIEALILQGFTTEEDVMAYATRGRAYVRKRKMIQKSLTAAALTTKERKSLPKSSFALPGTRQYPIQDRSHAANALARSAGKPEEAQVKRAVCRRYPDMGGCSK
jgi:hypothetical protein